jgi:hypothetical protein
MLKSLVSEKPSFGFIPIVIALLSLALGYWIGSNRSRRVFETKKTRSAKRKSNSESEGSSSSEVSSDGEPNVSHYHGAAFIMEECKLVIPVVRNGLIFLGFSRENRFRNDERQSCTIVFS